MKEDLVVLGIVALVLWWLVFKTNVVTSSNSKLKALGDAIAKAEGYGASPTNLPTRDNNPGDLTADLVGGSTGVDQGKVIYPTAAQGFADLMAELQKIADGVSKAGYSLSQSFFQFAATWVNGGKASTASDAWARTVAGSLGVDPNSTVGSYLGG